MFEVLEQYDWTAFAVITTLFPGYEDFVDYIEVLTDSSFIGWERRSTVTLNLTDDPDGARLKRQLREINARICLLYCSREEAESIFRAAREVKLTGPGYIWFMAGANFGRTAYLPEELPEGLFMVLSAGWKDDLYHRVQNGVAIIAKGAEALFQVYGSIPKFNSDCRAPNLTQFNENIHRLAGKEAGEGVLGGRVVQSRGIYCSRPQTTLTCSHPVPFSPLPFFS